MSMNKQSPGIEWTAVYGPGTGYTLNAIQGCEHDCQWLLPDGVIAQCYAKSIAEKFRSATFMPDGFETHYWHPERLKGPLKLKTPAGIFLDSFSDLFGRWVPDEQIEAVMDMCRQAHWHTFQILTKNAPRLRNFKFPPNVWVGASAPPSFFRGKELTLDQQRQMLRTTFNVLAQVKATVKWISFEPLTFDVSSCLAWAYEQHGNILQWAVIGAASNGPTIYQPKPLFVRLAIEQLREMNARIFFNGNLRGNAAAVPWLEEFPTTQKPEAYEQRHLI